MYKRTQNLLLAAEETCFLWGPRQTGKSTLLKTLFPDALRFDLLKSDEYRRLLSDPTLIRQECRAKNINGKTQKYPIIIDEVQKIPELLDEVHWMIENMGIRFILCGSSPRKLKQSHGNLLGGRAVRYELFPLIYKEIPDFDLENALNNGLIPRFYLSKYSKKLLQSYIADYLKEEISAEALTRNIPAFNRFLEVAAISNGEMINYQNIAKECGVSGPTVKEYFQILENTLIGRFIPVYKKQIKRRLVSASRFVFFDMGVVNVLTRRGTIQAGSELFGKAFEHFITLEIIAHSSYSESNYPIQYWRTASQIEVDLILGYGDVAIEIKSSSLVKSNYLRGLRAYKEEHNSKCIVVSLDPKLRETEDGILIMPWELFLEKLWSGKIMK